MFFSCFPHVLHVFSLVSASPVMFLAFRGRADEKTDQNSTSWFFHFFPRFCSVFKAHFPRTGEPPHFWGTSPLLGNFPTSGELPHFFHFFRVFAKSLSHFPRTGEPPQNLGTSPELGNLPTSKNMPELRKSPSPLFQNIVTFAILIRFRKTKLCQDRTIFTQLLYHSDFGKTI